MLHRPFVGSPLDDTHEFRTLGGARRYHDWDLPRMACASLLAVSRLRVIAAGGFDPVFAAGHGYDDTHLAARLIADGCKVVPLRQARGFHLHPPCTATRPDLVTPRNATLYHRLLTHPRTAVALTDQPDASRQLAEGTRLS